MSFVLLNNGDAILTRENGDRVNLSAEEIRTILDAMMEERWKYEIEDSIAKNDDWIDFKGDINSIRFAELCLDEARRLYEMYCDEDIDMDEIVFDIAQENGMWRD